MQSLNSLNNSEDCLIHKAQIHQTTLSMIWVKKLDDDGRERLVAIWTTQD